MKTKREKVLVAVAVIVVLIAVYLSSSSPGSSSSNASGPMLPLSQAVKKYDDGKTKYVALGNEVDTLQPLIYHLTSSKSADALSPLMASSIMDMAAKASIHITSLRPLSPEIVADGQAERVPTEIQFDAPFEPNAIKLLYLLEDPKGKYVVDQVQLTTHERHRNMVSVTARVSMFTTNVPQKGAQTNGS